MRSFVRSLSLVVGSLTLVFGAGCATDTDAPEGVAPPIEAPTLGPSALSAIKCGTSACIPGVFIDTTSTGIALDTYDTGYQPTSGSWSLIQHDGLGVKVRVPGKVNVTGKKGAVRITVPAPVDGVGGTPFRITRQGLAADAGVTKLVMDSRKGTGNVYKTVFDLTATNIEMCRVPSGFQGGCAGSNATFDVFIDTTSTGLRYGDGSPPVQINTSDVQSSITIPMGGGDDFVFNAMSQTMFDTGSRTAMRYDATNVLLAAPDRWGPGTYTRVVPDGTLINGLTTTSSTAPVGIALSSITPHVMPGDNLVWEVYVPPPSGVIAVSHSFVNVRRASVDVAVKNEVNVRFPISYTPYGVSYVWGQPQQGFTMVAAGL